MFSMWSYQAARGVPSAGEIAGWAQLRMSRVPARGECRRPGSLQGHLICCRIWDLGFVPDRDEEVEPSRGRRMEAAYPSAPLSPANRRGRRERLAQVDVQHPMPTPTGDSPTVHILPLRDGRPACGRHFRASRLQPERRCDAARTRYAPGLRSECKDLPDGQQGRMAPSRVPSRCRP